jgi:3-phenylpropionate/trans-cinnamate dioxygenase ferredoxin reductase component
VLVAVGALPNVELAEQAGLSMSHGGVLVDASLRSTDADIDAVKRLIRSQRPADPDWLADPQTSLGELAS